MPVFFYGTLIDIETNGLPAEDTKLLTLGIVSGDRLEIIQRTNEGKFNSYARQRLKNLPRPFYAFNKTFEEEMLDIKIDRELQSEQFEKKREAIKISGLPDPFDGQGYKVVSAWNNYITIGDKQQLGLIMDHNEACLLLEACLALVRWNRLLGRVRA